jgi:hypothetical protein
MCGTVSNMCNWHQCFDLVELIVALLCISDSAAHVCSLHNLAETCNSLLWSHLQSIGACTCVCSWHQCFDLTEHVVALFYISNSAAHICGLSYFTYLCNAMAQGDHIYRVLKHAQVCMTNIDPHLCSNPRSWEAAEFARC